MTAVHFTCPRCHSPLDAAAPTDQGRCPQCGGSYTQAEVTGRRAQLEALLARWQDLREQHQEISLVELCAGCPDLLPEMQSQIAFLRKMDARVDASSAETGGARQPAAQHPTQTEAEPPRAAPTGPDREHDGLRPPQAPGEMGWLGPYRVLGVLGKGGMGCVYLAEDPRLKRRIALKVLLPRHAADERARQRFLREAQAQAALEHDHIITIFQVDEDNGVPYLAMPVLKGETLADYQRRLGRLPLAQVLRIGREIAEGLAAAHAQGLIHRDIKPSNIWLEGERQRVKILDFGLARAVQDEAHLTGEGMMVGTPAFMSPEQARGLPLDARSDLFSLGSVLYLLTTGKQPFQGESTLAVLSALAVDVPAAPRTLNPDVAPELEALIVQLLAKEPAARPRAAGEVAQRLATLEQQRPQTAAHTPSATASIPQQFVPAADTMVEPAAPAGAPQQRRRSWLLGGAAVLLVVGGIIAVQQLFSGLTDAPEEVPGKASAKVAVVLKPDGAVVAQPAPLDPFAEPGADDELLPPWDLPAGAPKPALAPYSAAEAKQHQEAWAAYLKRSVIEKNTLEMKLALVPPGEFEMYAAPWENSPAEETRVRVRLTQPYYLGTTEVTWDQFRQFVEDADYKTDVELSGTGQRLDKLGPYPEGFKPNWRQPTPRKVHPHEPVVQLTSRDAEAFCAWLSRKEKATYRLPTEAEWEQAWRAGGTERFGATASGSELAKIGWLQVEPSAQESPLKAVGLKPANPFGLHDMIGNVWEYCVRLSLDRAVELINPNGFHGGIRGSSWHDAPPKQRSDLVRVWTQPTINLGFRVLCQVEKTPLPFLQPQLVRHGRPLSRHALVSCPAPIKGLRSWSVELLSHNDMIRDIAWSPQGDRIATGGENNGEVRVWDTQGRLLSILHGHDGWQIRVAFSPDGKLLASCELGSHASGPSCRIWDHDKNQCVATIPLGDWGHRVAFAPQGRRLAIARNGRGSSPLVVDLDTNRINEPGEDFQCEHIAWSADGTTLATHGVFWDAATLQCKGQVQMLDPAGKEGRPAKTVWSPDGRWLAGYLGRKVQIWDAKTLQPKQSFAQKDEIGGGMVWCKNSQRLATTNGGPASVTIWDALDGKILAESGHLPNCYGAAWSPDGREVVAIAHDDFVFLDSNTGKEIRRSSRQGQIYSRDCLLSPNGKEVATFAAGIWDADSGRFLRPLQDCSGGNRHWSPHSRWLAQFNFRDPHSTPVIVGRAQDWKDQRLLGGEGAEAKIGAYQVAWSPDERWLATASFDKAIRLYEVRTGKLIRKLTGHEKWIAQLAWSPDGKYLASTGEDQTIRLWDPQAGKLLQTWDDLPKGLRHLLAWLPDNRRVWFAAGSYAATLDVVTGERSPLEQFGGKDINALTLSASGSFLLVRNMYDWTFLRGSDPRQRRALGQGLGSWQAWHPDETRFLGGNGVGYDILRRQRLGTLIPHFHDGNWLCVGPDGHYRGSEKVHEILVYVAQTDAGEYLTLSPAEFERRFGWRNEPEKTRLLKRDP